VAVSGIVRTTSGQKAIATSPDKALFAHVGGEEDADRFFWIFQKYHELFFLDFLIEFLLIE